MAIPCAFAAQTCGGDSQQQRGPCLGTLVMQIIVLIAVDGRNPAWPHIDGVGYIHEVMQDLYHQQ